MRLFIALELPAPIKKALRAVQMAPARGVRPIKPEQMHVTLHFIGDADVDAVRQTLASVRCESFRVFVCGTGRFGAGNGQQILWAGVAVSRGLLELHAACARALAAIGIRIERRRYKPHVTLARLKSSADGKTAEAFLRSEKDKEFGSFIARRFALYDSLTAEDGARYAQIASWSLS